MDIGLPELIIILIIVLLLFGGSQLPKLSRSVGQSLRELREGFTSKETPQDTKKTEENNTEETKEAKKE